MGYRIPWPPSGDTSLGFAGSWHAYWDSQGIPGGTFGGRANAWLISQGFTAGELNGRWAAYVSGLGAAPPPPPPAAEFTIVMRTTGASETVVLPMSGSNNLDIDWGDGTVETGVTTDNPSHVYATADDYTIKVTGDTNQILFDGSGSEAKLIQVVAGGTGLNYNGTSMASAFRDCANLVSADFSGLDTSGVTVMGNMFQNCSSLTSLDLSGFNTSSVTNMSLMFRTCSSLTSLDVSGFDTSSVTNMSFMVDACSSLTSLDVSGFDTSSVTNMSFMFRNCTSLTSDPGIVSFDVTSITTAANMCLGANAMLSTAEYDAILIAWEAQAVNNSVPVHFGDATYTSGGAADTARTALANDHAWSITDGGPV